MSDAETPPPRAPLPQVRSRLPFDPNPFGRTVQRGTLYIYAVITAVLIGVAIYMHSAVGHPLFSGYVFAPAIGALWFGLRLFMMLGKR